MSRLLVTGANGFIGRACLDLAVKEGFDVHAVTGRRSNVDQNMGLERITWRYANLLEPSNLLEIVRPTHVLHLAWETTHGSYWTSRANLDWLGSSAMFMSKFAALGGRRFVSAGTCAEYAWDQESPVRESQALDEPQSFYGRVKLLHHKVLMTAAKQFGFSAATGRIFHAYGPRENPKRLVPYACLQFLSGKPALFSSGAQRRDFLHISDVAAGFVALLKHDVQGAFNISSGDGVQVADIVERLGCISGKPALVQLGAIPDRSGEPRMLVGDSSLLRGIGWKPHLTLDEGLTDTWRWWVQEGRSRELGH